MCSDPKDGPPLPRCAVCACGDSFPVCDARFVARHITSDSSPSHYWVYLDKEIFPFPPQRWMLDHNMVFTKE